MMKFSRAISRVKWLSGEKTSVSKTISVLVFSHPEDEDRDGLRNVDFFTAQPFDPVDSPRELLLRTCFTRLWSSEIHMDLKIDADALYRCINLVKKFPAFYGSLGFITVFTGVCHWSQS
jgi:hypothetical protein